MKKLFYTLLLWFKNVFTGVEYKNGDVLVKILNDVNSYSDLQNWIKYTSIITKTKDIFSFFIMYIKKTIFFILIALVAFIFWIFPISPVVAYFNSSTTDLKNLQVINEYKDLPGKSTTIAITDTIKYLIDRNFIMSYPGVRIWIDNKSSEEKGYIEMLRAILWGFEIHLTTNKGTTGKTKMIEKARAEFNVNYNYPAFTSFSTMNSVLIDYDSSMKNTLVFMDDYLKELESDKDLPLFQRDAVFIVNSDNFAQVLKLVESRLLDIANKSQESVFFNADDYWHEMKGNLIALRNVLMGFDYDFKQKMIDKSCYNDNFIPLIQKIDSAIAIKEPIIISQFIFNHVSNLETKVREISTLVDNLSDKLNDG